MLRRAISLLTPLIPTVAGSRAHAETGFFFCAEVVDDVCTSWTSVLDGVLSLDELGITPADWIELMSYGFGLVMLLWVIGLVAGSIARSLKDATQGE